MKVSGVCPTCGESFWRYISKRQYEMGKGKYCSVACSAEGRIGQKWSEESLKKIRIPRPERVQPRVTLNCPGCHEDFEVLPRLAAAGRKYCSERCMGIARRKMDGDMWLAKEQDVIRTSAEMKQWRTAVFKRDDYQCGFCGVRGGKLEADHIRPVCLYPELTFDTDNGQTLCLKCHKAKTRLDYIWYENLTRRL